MELAGDPLALAADRQVAQLDLEPVGLDRDRGLAGERGEGGPVVVVDRWRPDRGRPPATRSTGRRGGAASRGRSGRRPGRVVNAVGGPAPHRAGHSTTAAAGCRPGRPATARRARRRAVVGRCRRSPAGSRRDRRSRRSRRSPRRARGPRRCGPRARRSEPAAPRRAGRSGGRRPSRSTAATTNTIVTTTIGVERERQVRIEPRVAQQLEAADQDDRPEDRQPAQPRHRASGGSPPPPAEVGPPRGAVGLGASPRRSSTR